jgi:hypothetical protein
MHYLKPFLAVVMSTAIAAGITSLYGRGLQAILPADIPTIGRIETVRLPVGARTLGSVRTFVVRMLNVDDFGKITVNNYVELSNEKRDNFFFFAAPGDDLNRLKALSEPLWVDRKFYSQSKDVGSELLPGWNYIIVELENSTQGGCQMFLDIEVNGSRLEGFPRTFPRNSLAEPNVIDSRLMESFNKSGVSSIANALCARRIFAFYLENDQRYGRYP